MSALYLGWQDAKNPFRTVPVRISVEKLDKYYDSVCAFSKELSKQVFCEKWTGITIAVGWKVDEYYDSCDDDQVDRFLR